MQKQLFILTAYGDETRILLNGRQGDGITWNDRGHFEWEHADVQWNVLQSGMGKVRAASMCQMIIDQFQVARLYEFGFAGGIVDGLDVGDIVVVDQVMDRENPNRDEISSEVENGRQQIFHRCSDSIEAFAEHLTGRAECAVTTGTVICGDMDIYDKAERDAVASESGAIAADWESSAIVDVCSLNQVEYLGVRLISDKAIPEDKGAIPEEGWRRMKTSATIYLETLRLFESLKPDSDLKGGRRGTV